MRGVAAAIRLVGARARRRPGRRLLTALGVALAVAFAGTIASESTIAGDRAARTSLEGLSALDRTVRITTDSVITPSVELHARSLLRGLSLGTQTEVVLLEPVRLSGVVVRPAAIAPLAPWLRAGTAPPGKCTAARCPMLLAGRGTSRSTLTAEGVRVPIVGTTRLLSAAPLGFTPGATSDQPPLLITGDPAGLEALAGLSGVARTHGWLAPLAVGRLHSWQLAATERRLQQAQDALLSSNSALDLEAPFDALDAARAQADAAPNRLLLAGGGALAALALFIVLAVGGLRRDVHAELGRLETAGARTGQALSFVIAEAALLCGAALLLGAALAIATGAILASAAGLSAGQVLDHSLLTPTGAGALVAGWASATALVAVLLIARGTRIADLLAVAAAAALALALARGSSGSDPLPVLLAPLCCLAAGVLIFRGAAALLQGGERVARRGPVLTRLAFVGLARSPAMPSLAIAFIAVSIGLGAFALAYRATLLRGAADQAANRVPLDATIAAGPHFTTPLELASAPRWDALARGRSWTVRRTDASYVSGGSSVTVPALGIPAAVLTRIHGWRASDGSAAMTALRSRLVPRGAARNPGPTLPPDASALTLPVRSPAVAVTVTADLRTASDEIVRVGLGQAGPSAQTLRARLPRQGGPFELDGLELTEPAGLEATNGHQNGENVAASTQFTGSLTLGRLLVVGRTGRRLAGVALASWRALGAAALLRASGPQSRDTVLRFSTSGETGLVRPPQPSDSRPVPVLVDPHTAAVAGRAGRLALSVDGLAVDAHVVGVLQRFPTIPGDAAGFIVADQQTLSGALDAQSPGQGRPDELWVSATDTGPLRSLLARGRFTQLSSSFRADVERQLRSAPVARAVLGTLIAAAALAGALAVIGLLVALLGATRDERIERDLIAQGVGPRGIRTELRLRLMLAGLIGVLVGLLTGVILTSLAVQTVRASGTVAVPRPPLVTVAPWAQLAVWGLVALGVLAAAAWLATRTLTTRTAP
jgi:hypothetical protein